MQTICRIFASEAARNTFTQVSKSSRNVLSRCFVQSSTEKQLNILDSLYSDNEKMRILESFNKCSEHELQLTRQINSYRALSVVQYRTDHGDFQTLSDILKVPGMGILSLQKVCNKLKSIDYEHLQDIRTKQDSFKVKCQPTLSQDQCEDLETLVAVDIHIDGIVWTKMDRKLNVQDWNHATIFDKPIQKYDPVVFLEKMHAAVEKLPTGDIFVMENKIYRFSNIRIVPFLTNLRVIEAMLFTHLNKDFSSSDDHKVYHLQSALISRLFSLTVGGERVSGQHIVRDIKRRTSEHGDVNVPQSCWETYLKLDDSVKQEKYSNCLLLAMAFYKLIVLKTHTLST